MARENPQGEFALIDRMASFFPKEAEGLSLGVGDDCAVFRDPAGGDLLASCDVLVEGVHFLPGTAPELLGARAVSVALSDIAAMGGLPWLVFVSLGAPEDVPSSYWDLLAEGMGKQCARYGAAVAGGNLTRSPGPMFLDLFVLGRVEQGRALLRSGARPGDLIAVTGSLGASAAGLALLRSPQAAGRVPEAFKNEAVRAHTSPEPQVAAGRTLCESGLVTAALDISDGLCQDLGHICEASGVGARVLVDSLPISTATRAAAGALGESAEDFAITGGEDYQLLFTMAENTFERLAARVEKEAGPAVTAIGKITGPGEGRLLAYPGGETAPFPAQGGHDHFQGKSNG